MNRAGALVADGHCLWLYAVAGDAADHLPADVTGVGGAAARPLRAAGFVAVVAEVDESEFGADALHRNLQDLDWLERTARAHHAVIEAVAGTYPVVPARLATVSGFRGGSGNDAARTGGRLPRGPGPDRRAQRMGSQGVRGHARRPDGLPDLRRKDLAAPPPAPGRPTCNGAGAIDRAPGRPPGSGGQRADRGRGTGPAVGFRSPLPPQAPDLAGRSATMVLNAAYLVADERADEFVAAVSELATSPAVQLTLTGP